MPEQNQQKATIKPQPAEEDMRKLSVDFLVSAYSFTPDNAEKFMDLWKQTANDPGIGGAPFYEFIRKLLFGMNPVPLPANLGTASGIPQPPIYQRPTGTYPPIRPFQTPKYWGSSPLHPGIYRATTMVRNSAEAADALKELKQIEADYRKGLCLDEATPFAITVEDSYVANVDNSSIVVKDGMLTASVRIAKAMVQDYNGVKVLKCYHELKKAADHARQLPITMGHPPDKVVTSQDQIKGWTTPPQYVEADRALDCVCQTNDEKLVKTITDEKKTDVSIGFHCDLVMTPGEYNGVKYDGIQTNIVLNHVAMGINKGRCPGGECGVGVGTMKTDEKDYEVNPTPQPIPGEPGGPGVNQNTKVLSPEELALLTPKERAEYEEWLKQHPIKVQMLNVHPDDCECDACKKKKGAKKDVEATMPPAEGAPTESQEKIPELSSELQKAVEAFGTKFAESMGKRATLSVAEINKVFTELTTMLSSIKEMVAKEKGKAPTEQPTPTNTEIVEKADALILMAEPSLRELAKARDSMIAKVDSIMDFKPTKPRAEYEKMNDETLTDERIKFLQSARNSHSISDSVDPIDKAYASILEKRRK